MLSTLPTLRLWAVSLKLPLLKMLMLYGSTTHLYPTIEFSGGCWMWLQPFARLQSRSVCLIAIISHFSYFSLRFKLLDSVSNILRSSSFNASFPNHLGFPSTATFDGDWYSACLNAHTSYKRCVVFFLILRLSTDMQHLQPIDLFLQLADSLYGPITTICCNDHIKKKIPWSAFFLTERDWE